MVSPRGRRTIREECDRAGVTLQHLARQTGLRVDTLRKIDSAGRNPLVTTALRLAQALGLEVEQMFGRA